MIQVIETNLSIDKDDTIRDHQTGSAELEDCDVQCNVLGKYIG